MSLFTPPKAAPSSSSTPTPSKQAVAISAFLGGAASGIMTSLICSPLDVTKVRIQVQVRVFDVLFLSLTL